MNKEASIEVEPSIESPQKVESQQLKENDKSSFLEPPKRRNLRSRSKSDKKKMSGRKFFVRRFVDLFLHLVGKTEPDESRDVGEYFENKQIPLIKGFIQEEISITKS